MNPKSLDFTLFPFFGWLTAVFLLSAAQTAHAMSAAEADAVVAAGAAEQSSREAELRERLRGVPALEEKTVRLKPAGETVLVRRLAPALREPVAGGDAETSAGGELESGAPPAGAKPETAFTLLATVGQGGSLIRAMDPETGVWHTAAGGITRLPPVLTVETAEARHTFFSIITETDTALSTPPGEPAVAAADHKIHSGGGPVSGAFQAVMAALHARHAEHGAAWEAEARRSAALQAARERHLEENPPEPREITVNVRRVHRQPAGQP